jgi:hypothetical protein
VPHACPQPGRAHTRWWRSCKSAGQCASQDMIPLKAVAPVRIRSGLPQANSPTRPLTCRNDGQRPCCASDRGPVRSGCGRACVPVTCPRPCTRWRADRCAGGAGSLLSRSPAAKSGPSPRPCSPIGSPLRWAKDGSAEARHGLGFKADASARRRARGGPPYLRGLVARAIRAASPNDFSIVTNRSFSATSESISGFSWFKARAKRVG